MRPFISILTLLFIVSSCKPDKSKGKDQTASVPDSFNGTVQLIEERCCPPGCGTIAWANAQKFLVVKSDFEQLKGKKIIIIERCPQFKGKGFFRTGETYQVKASSQYDSVFLVFNYYEKEKLPTYWSEAIAFTK